MISEKAYQATALGNFTRIAPEIPVRGCYIPPNFTPASRLHAASKLSIES